MKHLSGRVHRVLPLRLLALVAIDPVVVLLNLRAQFRLLINVNFVLLSQLVHPVRGFDQGLHFHELAMLVLLLYSDHV